MSFSTGATAGDSPEYSDIGLSSDLWSVETRLRLADSLFINSNEGICITDLSEVIIDVNPTLCALTSYDRAELIGNTPRIFSSQLHDKAFFSALWHTLLTNGQWRGEVWNRHRDGSLYAVRLNISAVHDQNQNISHFVGILADITEQKLLMQSLEKNANFDILTGLPNRLLFNDRLHLALAQADRTSTMLAVCFLDLDGFKAINDSHGHQAGDLVLQAVASRMALNVRSGDTIARLGGDEFIILLWGLQQASECRQMLERLQQAICQPVQLPQLTIVPAVSIGVAVYPADAQTAERLLALADTAMYRAKTAGGNRIAYHQA